MKKNIFQNNNYLFVLAHPDDEVYCSVLMSRLVKEGKQVTVLYVTSGDSGGNSKSREREVLSVMKLLGIKKRFVNFLRISEKDVFDNLFLAVNLSSKIVRAISVDCIISQDYEGGHECHDAISFISSEIVRLNSIREFYVFPVYHGRPEKRIGARFKNSRKKFIKIPFDIKDISLKKAVLSSHESQQKHFIGLRNATSDYWKLLFSREVYFKIVKPIVYTKKPDSLVGYEYHRNGFKFKDFLNALEKYSNKIKNK